MLACLFISIKYVRTRIKKILSFDIKENNFFVICGMLVLNSTGGGASILEVNY